MRVERVPFRLISAATAAVLLAACGPKQSAPPQQTPEVGVVTVQPTAVPVVTELPGRTSAFLVAQVRARVDGIVLRREFTEGGEVKAGQRLYKIDPAPYIATLNNAKATLAKAQANLASTTAQANRYKVLVAANAVSKQDYDNAVASAGQAAADVAAGKAAVDTAQINLGYTDVTSPVTGQIGVSQVTPGAFVQQSAERRVCASLVPGIRREMTVAGFPLPCNFPDGRVNRIAPQAFPPRSPGNRRIRSAIMRGVHGG